MIRKFPHESWELIYITPSKTVYMIAAFVYVASLFKE